MPHLQDIAHYFFLGLISALFLVFSIYSLVEKQKRAFFISIIVSVFFLGFSIFWHELFKDSIFLLIPTSVIFFAGLLIYIPRNNIRKINYDPSIMKRVDERDTMFARASYKPGSGNYTEYYISRPELKETDDKIRAQIPLLEKGGRFYHPLSSHLVRGMFELENDLAAFVSGECNAIKNEGSPDEYTRFIKDTLLYLGASEVGVCKLTPAFIYSNTGKGPEKWGYEIHNDHKFAIVYTIEMDFEMVRKAPMIPTVVETAKKYLEAQRISISIANFIRSLGYDARAHVSGSNYQLILPPLAYEAGLGELGRCGYLISKGFGARVRLGAVSTNLPLITDKPVDFGVQDFCNICKKCAVNCPTGSIPKDGKTIINGVEKWQTEIESCYKYWRYLGTDCAICMKVCPYSHPNNPVHNIVRKLTSRNNLIRRILIHADDLFYGRKAS